ncbi:MAG: sensor histidine kinase, partial [Butyrivibrio sp.]
LNMKMRVHDDVGRSVIATRRLLWQHKPTKELNLDTWKTAIHLLKHDNEYIDDKVTLERLSFSASCMGIRIITTGELPMDAKVSELIISAIRECMTNAVRHAGATRLYVNLSCTDDMAYAVITNDGAIPQGKITEGGGLSSLRARIRNGGGTMEILSEPEFELKVAVPCKKTDEYSGRRI